MFSHPIFLRIAPLLLALLSGAAALSHQLVWTRRLVDLLGAGADTFSKVIGAFFAGLALGAWLASRVGDRFGNDWRRVALAEIAVALLALPVLLSFGMADWIWQSLSPGPFGKLLLAALLVAPPATAMGLAVPWMIRALESGGQNDPRLPVWLYAANTLGGVLGLGATLLFALPRFGLVGAGAWAIGLNLLVAALAMTFPRGSPDTAIVGEQPPAAHGDAGSPRLLAFFSGFLVLALEVILQHQIAQVSINSLFSSGLVLAMVLIALALAAALVPVLVRKCGDDRRAAYVALILAALACLAQPFLLTSLRDGVNILPYELTVLPYTWELGKLGLIAVMPVFLAAGLLFPLLIRAAGSARGISRLLAWNGFGGWLGAEFAQAGLGPAFGLWQSVIALGAGYVMLALAAFEAGRRRLAMGGLVALLAAGAFIASRSLPQATVQRTEKLRALRVGREGVVATLECAPGDWRMLFNNSYTLGGSRAQFNQERQALLPVLLHGDARSVGVLGVATGGTTAGAALHPGVGHVEAVELSPLVLGYAREFFGPYNREIFANPRVHFLAEDARWVIASRRAAYDVVVGDLFLPWRTGEGRLFAREHFENVRRSLKPGGVYCQWLPMFQLTRPQFEVIARTFREVFPDAFVLRGDFYVELPILGLVGGRDLRAVDWEKVAAACDRLRADGNASDPLVRHAEGVAMSVLGPLPPLPPGPVNTLGNAWLEWDAGRNILGLREPWFVGAPCAGFTRELQQAGALLLPERLRPAQLAGDFFLTLEMAAKLNLPIAAGLTAQVPERLPPALLNDAQADWRQWPMRVKPK